MNNSPNETVKAGRNQFKCYHCRRIIENRNGDWYEWDAMEVHLCRTCERATANAPERNRKKG